MRQGKVSRAQAVKCPENTQGISKGVTTFHPYKTCDFPFSMSLDETYKKKKNITLRVWLFSIFIPLYRFSYIAFLLSRNTKKYLENSIPSNTIIHFQERKSFRKKKRQRDRVSFPIRFLQGRKFLCECFKPRLLLLLSRDVRLVPLYFFNPNS